MGHLVLSCPAPGESVVPKWLLLHMAGAADLSSSPEESTWPPHWGYLGLLAIKYFASVDSRILVSDVPQGRSSPPCYALPVPQKGVPPSGSCIYHSQQCCGPSMMLRLSAAAAGLGWCWSFQWCRKFAFRPVRDTGNNRKLFRLASGSCWKSRCLKPEQGLWYKPF